MKRLKVWCFKLSSVFQFKLCFYCFKHKNLSRFKSDSIKWGITLFDTAVVIFYIHEKVNSHVVIFWECHWKLCFMALFLNGWLYSFHILSPHIGHYVTVHWNAGFYDDIILEYWAMKFHCQNRYSDKYILRRTFIWVFTYLYWLSLLSEYRTQAREHHVFSLI